MDKAQSLEDRLKEGNRLFKLRNRPRNPTFSAVRDLLRSMCRGPNRCMYCEDSSADQIDHFRPKDFYPDRVFDWGNDIWSCGRCNRRKSNRFSIVRAAANDVVEVRRDRQTPPIRPPKGNPAYWNPRHYDPLNHMMLDLRDTFEFVSIDAAGTINFERTRQTIKAAWTERSRRSCQSSRRRVSQLSSPAARIRHGEAGSPLPDQDGRIEECTAENAPSDRLG